MKYMISEIINSKYILTLVLLGIVSINLNAQKYITKTGFTEFKASVEAFEPVEAKTKSTTAVLNTETGDVAALLFIKSFKFKVALMEEHFNENYMDSDKYPKAVFKGSIKNFNMEDLSSESKTYKLSGTLTIRGKSKNIITDVLLSKENDVIKVVSGFSVKPEEFGIDIPSVVSNKIAETINIDLAYELIKK